MRKKGISLIVLVITIIVAIILTSTIIISSEDIVEKAKKSEFAKEIYTIQNKAKEYKFKNGNYPVTEEITFNLGNIKADDREQFNKESGYIDGKINFQVIDLESLDIESVNRGMKKNSVTDIYVISNETGIIYYLNGEYMHDKTYYTLTDELKSLIGVTK